jgi:phage gpG-like protein
VSDFSFSGDIAAVDQLARQIGMLGRREFQRDMLREMGEAGVDLVHEEFAASHDPEGHRWEPLKNPRRFGAGPLVKTGALQGSIRMRLTAEGFVLHTLKKYAPFHQHGTRNMVARPFFPVGTPPTSWLTRFDQIADAHMRRLLPMAA